MVLKAPKQKEQLKHHLSLQMHLEQKYHWLKKLAGQKLLLVWMMTEATTSNAEKEKLSRRAARVSDFVKNLIKAYRENYWTTQSIFGKRILDWALCQGSTSGPSGYEC